MTTVWRNLEDSPKGSVRGMMALWGQTVIHSPQSMHFSSMITALPFLILIAWVGHVRRHFIRPLHFSGSIRMEWKYWFILFLFIQKHCYVQRGSFARLRKYFKL